MKKDRTKLTLYIITTILCFIPTLIGLLLYNNLPLSIPVHWNSAGTAGSYASRLFVILGMPIIFAIINFIIHFELNNSEKKKKMNRIIKLATKFLTPIIDIILLGFTFIILTETKVDILKLSSTTVGIIIIIMGVFLPKVEPNSILGYKVPWTLTDDSVWKKTHEFASAVWIVGGLALIASIFLPMNQYVRLIILLVTFVLPLIFSYIIYKIKEKSE